LEQSDNVSTGNSESGTGKKKNKNRSAPKKNGALKAQIKGAASGFGKNAGERLGANEGEDAHNAFVALEDRKEEIRKQKDSLVNKVAGTDRNASGTAAGEYQVKDNEFIGGKEVAQILEDKEEA